MVTQAACGTERVRLDSAAWSASAAVCNSVASGFSVRDAAHQRSPSQRCRGAATHADCASETATPAPVAGKRRRGRPTGKVSTSTLHGTTAEHSGRQADKRRQPLPRRRQLKVPPEAPPAAVDPPTGAAPAPAPGEAHNAGAASAQQAASPDAPQQRAALPQQQHDTVASGHQPTPSSAQQQHVAPASQQQSPAPAQQPGPPTPLLQDFLSGRGRLVKSVYRQQGLHELQLQQEFAEQLAPLPQLPDVASPSVPESPQPQVSIWKHLALAMRIVCQLHCLISSMNTNSRA